MVEYILQQLDSDNLLRLQVPRLHHLPEATLPQRHQEFIVHHHIVPQRVDVEGAELRFLIITCRALLHLLIE